MRKSYPQFLLIAFFFMSTGVNYSQSFHKTWQLSRDSTGYTEFNRIALLSDHTIAVGGRIMENDHTFPVLMNIDTLGNVNWTKIFRDTSDIVFVSNDTAYFLNYSVTSLSADASGITLAGICDSTALIHISSWAPRLKVSMSYIIKTDLHGNLLWQKRYSLPFQNRSYFENNSVIYFQDNSTGYLISSYSDDDGMYNRYGQLTKLDPSDGSVQFTSLFRENFWGPEMGITSAVYSHGRVIFSFVCRSTPNRGIACLDSNGTMLWSSSLSEPDFFEIPEMKLSKDGNFVYGAINGEFPFSRPYAFKVDLFGNFDWFIDLQLPSYERIFSVETDSNSNFYFSDMNNEIAGVDSTWNGLWRLTSNGSKNFLLWKSDNLYSCGMFDRKAHLVKFPVLPANSCVNYGSTGDATLFSTVTSGVTMRDSLIPSNGFDLGLISVDSLQQGTFLCSLPVGTRELERSDQSIFPNPVDNAINLVSYSDFKSFEVFSLNGINLADRIVIKGDKADVSMLSPGIYLARITLNSGLSISKKFTVQR